MASQKITRKVHTKHHVDRYSGWNEGHRRKRQTKYGAASYAEYLYRGEIRLKRNEQDGRVGEKEAKIQDRR